MEISIVVPVYNVESYIEKCIESILGQTIKNFEIIIVNDGTKDKSIEKIQRFLKGNPNIKIINQKNAGLSAARNTGLRHAIGKYVCFIDSDDWIEPNFLENLYTVAEKNSLDIACAGYQRKHNDMNRFDEVQKRSEGLISYEVLSGEDALIYQYRTSEYRMEVWDDLFRRQFLLENKLKFKEGYIHEDEIFTPLAMIKAKKVQFIEDTSYCYRQRENSIMSSTKNKERANNLYIVAVELAGYIDLVQNIELKKFFAMNAKNFYISSLAFGNNSRLPECAKKNISINLEREKTFKDSLALNAPKLAVILFNFKKVLLYAKK